MNTLLPATIDNTYRGQRLGLWLLALVVAVKAVQILSVMVAGPTIVAAAGGIPLGTFGKDAAHTVVIAFIAMGISRLFIAVITTLALLRYRSVVAPVFG